MNEINNHKLDLNKPFNGNMQSMMRNLSKLFELKYDIEFIESNPIKNGYGYFILSKTLNTKNKFNKPIKPIKYYISIDSNNQNRIVIENYDNLEFYQEYNDISEKFDYSKFCQLIHNYLINNLTYDKIKLILSKSRESELIEDYYDSNVFKFKIININVFFQLTENNTYKLYIDNIFKKEFYEEKPIK